MQIITGSAGIAQADPDSYATPRVVAAHLRTTEAELAQDRHRGIGIPFTRSMSRGVLYRVADVLAYANSQAAH